MSRVIQAYAEESELIMSYLGMDRVNDKACRGSEVPLRVLWCKGTGGGGSLATSHRERRSKRRYIHNC